MPGNFFGGEFFGGGFFGAIEEEAAERPPTVDFVVSPPYWSTVVAVYRRTLARTNPTRDEEDLQEMMQLCRLAGGAR